jgi:predicted kinase
MSRLQAYILNEGINDKGIFKACFMAGNPGAGKSYVISKIKAGDIEPRIVNVDNLNEYLKAFTQDQREAIYDKVHKITSNQLANYINSMLPLWIDGTATKVSQVNKRNKILKNIGYDTAMIWVNTTLETSQARAEKRKRKVPPEIIEQLYNAIQKVKPKYKSMFDVFIEVNNNDGELDDQTILRIYKKMSKFFNSPVKNKIGKDHIEDGSKYLADGELTIDDIKGMISGWF